MNQDDCKACAARGFAIDAKGQCYHLDVQLHGVVEVRRCDTCLRLYYAVPLEEWADVVAGHTQYEAQDVGVIRVPKDLSG